MRTPAGKEVSWRPAVCLATEEHEGEKIMAQRVGSGDFIYEVDERWGQLPASWSFVDAVGIVVDRDDRVYVFNRGAHPIIIFERDGRLAGSWGEGQFSNAHGLQIGADGSIYTVDTGDHTVRKWTPDGRLLLTLGTPGQAADTGFTGDLDTLRGGGPFNRPTNVAEAPDGSLYVSDGYANCRVHHFAADGTLLHSWGEPGRGPGQFRLVHGICVAPDGSVFVGDRANDRVQVFSPTGEYLREWSDVRQPDEVHLGPDSRFYVAELGYQDATAGQGLRRARHHPRRERPHPDRLGRHRRSGRRRQLRRAARHPHRLAGRPLPG
jgi:DNA-binding beta-propeller fold protein YncE